MADVLHFICGASLVGRCVAGGLCNNMGATAALHMKNI